ncbi:hypothetical protein [Spongiactinospora rosea]|uniref:hypothetical protein n=1 Tax=Spongiactinospora rosea TaxID=2248750 RepID=UPI0011C0448A|nr:hypothetical protein [Spongiactinospora rosea]
MTHYATDGHADPARYARTMAGSRNHALVGYEVYIFGAYDLSDVDQARELLSRFFPISFAVITSSRCCGGRATA